MVIWHYTLNIGWTIPPTTGSINTCMPTYILPLPCIYLTTFHFRRVQWKTGEPDLFSLSISLNGLKPLCTLFGDRRFLWPKHPFDKMLVYNSNKENQTNREKNYEPDVFSPSLSLPLFLSLPRSRTAWKQYRHRLEAAILNDKNVHLTTCSFIA